MHRFNSGFPCLSNWSHSAPLAQPGKALKYYISLYVYFFKIQRQFSEKYTKLSHVNIILFASDFLSISVKTNQAPSLPFSLLCVHVVSNCKHTACLHWEHWSKIWLSVELCFCVLVFCLLQGHCLLTQNTKWCIPGCVHLKYVVIPGWYWMMSVWASRVWWSERKLVNLMCSKTNWNTAQSIINFWVVVGWK